LFRIFMQRMQQRPGTDTKSRNYLSWLLIYPGRMSGL
jgi:hypothetical protein